MNAIPTFPSTEGMQTSSDGSEFIYGGSIAINRILGRLRDTAGPRAVPYRLWLINAYTLLENVFKPDAREEDIVAALHMEVNLLVQYIEAYMSHCTGPFRPPTIVFYAPTYRIPDKLLREQNKDTKSGAKRIALDRLYAKLQGSLFGTQPLQLNRAQAFSLTWSVPVGSRNLPHRDLAIWVNNAARDLTYVVGSDPVALITHCPIDFHITRQLSNIDLHERYTGEVIKPRAFGKKLHDSGHVPFGIYTHQLFGDKVHLASRMDVKTKKAIVAAAEKDKWAHKTDSEILTAISRITGLKSTDFTLKL